MKMYSIDHTSELEQRLAAIKINVSDSCAFFKQREGCMFSQKLCCYCAFAKFIDESVNVGFCKFKKQAFIIMKPGDWSR